jgi:hypothetical protein
MKSKDEENYNMDLSVISGMRETRKRLSPLASLNLETKQ